MTWTLVVFLLILAVSVLTAAAASVRGVSRIWLRHWAELRLRGGGDTELFLERPHRLVLGAAVASGIVITFIGGLVAVHAQNRVLVLTADMALTTAVLVALGQLVPRAAAQRWPELLAPLMLPLLRLVTLVLTPVLVVERLVRAVIGRRRPAGAPGGHDALEDVLREGVLEGVGEHEEIAIISGVIEFGDRLARDVMTKRADVFAIEERTAPDAMARQIALSGYSRIPIFRGTMDQIVGMVHAFDVLTHGNAVVQHMHRVAVARGTTRCNVLLHEMLRQRRHLTVVQDDTGQMIGIVTLEDVLEELVGDIRDEHDEPAAAPSDQATPPPAGAR